MGKATDSFKKIRDIKGIFHSRMYMIKDKNSKDLTEAEEIKKKCQEYPEELHKKGLNELVVWADNLSGVVIWLESDILECEVKRALGRIATNKASVSDGIPAEVFKILKNYAVKMLHSEFQDIWKTHQWPQNS